MNDRPPSGVTTPTGTAHDASYPPYDASYAPSDGHGVPYGYPAGGAYADDPLFGAMPDNHGQPTATGFDAFAATGHHSDNSAPLTDNYGTGAYDTGSHQTAGHDFAASWQDAPEQNAPDPRHFPDPSSQQGNSGWSPDSSGQWSTVPDAAHGAYPADPYVSDAYGFDPYAGGGSTGGYGTGAYRTTEWDGGQAGQPGDQHHDPSPGQDGGYAEQAADGSGANGWESGAYATVSWEPVANASGSWDTGSWDTAAFTSVPRQPSGSRTGEYPADPDQHTGGYHGEGHHPDDPNPDGPSHDADTAENDFRNTGLAESGKQRDEFRDSEYSSNDYDAYDHDHDHRAEHEAHAGADGLGADALPDEEPPVREPVGAAGAAHPAAPSSRGRRRAVKPRRSALLTVAVPSVAVMGVAGIAAASVGAPAEDLDDKPVQAAADGAPVKPSAANRKLDTQLAGLSADAGDFADRASRTQERIDLKERQEAERKRKEAEAIRKEALRPKFALPVAQHGLSAYYGQAGINWMSVHTGIDFPVGYGTPVLAATDGTVSTKWDLSYGNMAIVTAADGTETWYCHLSSTKIRSGPVKAGETIGYAGSSGNSTGPHLHFEVRPGGGSAVDPVAWFRTKGLDPT
ncbi:M23 family metallopeptidase [Streptomyces sp. 549]|uniref:M23 family metallopeptidase n=1 Tax=Streptomyces sp. 549 TaxID=3049076 RepID=UPI0024C23903|nr:M23 family metallopeptidase [Streptomyces sp. 549]MDK1472792.1 M23 family metallopeptidase [Streptomyces sp. 549]